MDKNEFLLKLEKHKNLISIIFIVLLGVQLLVYGYIDKVGKESYQNVKQLQKLKVEAEETFIRETIRPQERKQLNAIREGWVQYFQSNSSEQLLIKEDNKYVYTNQAGEKIVYDPEIMDRDKNPDQTFNLKDKKSNNILIANARPIWNKDAVKKVLDIVASPVRAFGASGDVIIFDSYTGEMILDNSVDCKDTPEVLGADGKRYITLDDKHPNNKNPKLCKEIINKEFLWRKDTEHYTGMIYFFNEPTDMGKEANNFCKYPLGEYKREFQEKIILPYQTVGVEGQEMQITIVLGAQEDEITMPYNKVESQYNSLKEDMTSVTEIVVFGPMISIITSFVIILVAMFSIRISAHSYKSNFITKDKS